LLIFAIFLSQGWATMIGSSTTKRNFTGGFRWFGSVFSGTRDLTHLLSEGNGGAFPVVAISAPETLRGRDLPSFSFGLQTGTNIVTAGNADSVNFDPTVDSEAGSLQTDRTYSAQASSGVAEPGTFSFIAGAGLVLAGLFRYRYTRGRQS
jgi:hypothetical protein